mmetsp:Transcript_10806/g.10827  ORF Transcript_10806/g.10827 Transcript_10806/m.10827 type:complete len:845 (-) Transcript_10806:175-2709(-)|eukprot:CAMPEP_0182425966 /NCGR_PEP_ID=MMETSP1167-20130531/12448_1 /TAXON_ID=2988 /ORGANISM="Mallomonas Sp, Strain CCMP3275" /LENGTH=844 /DNA_ID=CAMNT_0024607071 /DNA_START=104 /DNA_END=2638 /DNA_ORIENTATION=+
MENRLCEEDGVSASKNDIVFGDSLLGVAFCRSDLIRVMMKSLLGMGFRESALKLQTESGLRIQSEDIEIFFKTIMKGSWSDCLEISKQIDFIDEIKRQEVHIMILERKYVEYLEEKNLSAGIHCLRNELRPLVHDIKRLNELSNLLICPHPTHISDMLLLLNISPTRRMLQEKIKTLISPLQLIQENRLETLLLQSLQSQVNPHNQAPSHSISTLSINSKDERSGKKDIIHIPSAIPLSPAIYSVQPGVRAYASCRRASSVRTLSLLYDADNRVLEDRLPTYNEIVLEGHLDEVWVVSFSPQGSRLASASRDGGLNIWNMEIFPPKLLYVLKGLDEDTPACSLSWSSDASQLLCVARGESRSSVLRWELQSEDTTGMDGYPVSVGGRVDKERMNGHMKSELSRHGNGCSNGTTAHHHRADGAASRERKASSVSSGTETGEGRGRGRETETETGMVISCSQRYEMHLGEISCASWVPVSVPVPLLDSTSMSSDLQFFVSGGVDRQLLLCDQWGVCLARLTGRRIGDMAVLFPTTSHQYSSMSESTRSRTMPYHPPGGRWLYEGSERSNGNSSHMNGYGGNGMRGKVIDGYLSPEDSPESNDARRYRARQTLSGYRVLFVSAEKWIRLVYIVPKDSEMMEMNCPPEKLVNNETTFNFIDIATLCVEKPIISLSLPSSYPIEGCMEYLHTNYSTCSQRSSLLQSSLMRNNVSDQLSSINPNTSRISVLVSVEGGDLFLVDVQSMDESSGNLSLGRKIRGCKQAQLCLYPGISSDCNGRPGLIACGSEGSGDVIIWDPSDGLVLTTLTGHSGVVNSVSWSSERVSGERILATASDDHTVRIWTTEMKR